VVPAHDSENADSYGLLGNGNEVLESVDFRFDILRWALAANPASAVGVVGDIAGESVTFKYGSITDKGLKISLDVSSDLRDVLPRSARYSIPASRQ
jgi:hypothetical protein